MNSNLKSQTQQSVVLTAESLAREFVRTYSRPLALGCLALAVTDLTDVVPPLIIKASIDAIESGKGMNYLALAAVGLIIAALIQGVARFFWRKYFLGTSHVAGYELRKRMYEHLQELPYDYFNKTRTGDLMSRLTNDLDEVRMMMGLGILLMMDALFYFLTVPFFMFWMSPRLTMYLMIPLPIIPFIVVKIGRMFRERSERAQERMADLSAKAQESISGIRVTKVFSLEEQEIKFLNSFSFRLFGANMSLAKVGSIFDPALELCVGLAICFLIFAGGRLVISQSISLGSFVAFQAYLLKMVWPMMAIGFTINVCQRGMAALGRCSEILNQQKVLKASKDASITLELPCTLEVRNLTFSYPGSENRVLNDISFILPPGRVMGLVGPVGCGKTTLLQLMVRLLEPPEGTVFINGRDILDYELGDLRKIFGFVPQDSFLFSESISENINFALDEKNDVDFTRKCAQKAGILEEIDALPMGMATMLGERGVNLSGGQKQRVSIARALAKDPAVLVLDDATSSVDTDTEERILKNLGDVLASRSGIIVSHRLVSVQNADLIMFLEKGCVIERGSHAQLLEQNGRYATLWEKQRLKSELERSLAGANGEKP